jgi:hypothetical protein
MVKNALQPTKSAEAVAISMTAKESNENGEQQNASGH